MCMGHLLVYGQGMGAYKRNMKSKKAYIHGCLFSVGAYYPDFMVL